MREVEYCVIPGAAGEGEASVIQNRELAIVLETSVRAATHVNILPCTSDDYRIGRYWSRLYKPLNRRACSKLTVWYSGVDSTLADQYTIWKEMS